MAGVLMALEVVMRAVSAFPRDSACFTIDAAVGYRARPNVACAGHATNALGFHDVAHARAKPPGVLRLAYIGDSFVVSSVAPEDSLVGVTRQLAGGSARPIEVLNLGLMSAGPKNYLGLLRTDAVALRVDVACVIVFVGDDITQSHPDLAMTVWLGSPRETVRRPFLVGPSFEYSYAGRLLRTAWRSAADRLFTEPDATMARASFLSIERQRLGIYAREPTAFIRDACAGAERTLAMMAETAALHGIRLIAVLVPDEVQVNGRVRTALAGSADLGRYDFDRPQRLLSEALAANHVPVVDLLPVLRERGAMAGVYLKYNTHWNELGNRVAAETVWEFLGRSGVLGR